MNGWLPAAILGNPPGRWAAAMLVALLAALALPFQVGGHEIVVTASAGIAVFPTDGANVETLLKNADTAMYHAKEQGKDNFQFFSPSMNASSLHKLTMENMLRKAVERGELVLHYQPKVEARGGVGERNQRELGAHLGCASAARRRAGGGRAPAAP